MPVPDEVDDDHALNNKTLFLTNSIDPPLVTATRLQDEPRRESLVIQAVVICDDDEETLQMMSTSDVLAEDTVASSSLTTQSTNIHQQHDSSRIESVQIDELPSQQSQDFQTKEEEESMSVCRRYWKIILLVVACLVIGVGIGMGMTLKEQEGKSTNKEGFVNTPMPSFAPSMTVIPSSAPSCEYRWETTLSHSLDSSFGDYANFAVSPDGSTAVLTTLTQERFSGRDAFFVTTLDITETHIYRSSFRNEKLDISDSCFSLDGSRLVLSISNDINAENDEQGGALRVYERVQQHIWVPLHYLFMVGGNRGTLSSVATNDAGTVYAIITDNYANNIPAHVQVYQSIEEELMPMGDRLVEGSMNTRTFIGLSGSGERLIVYTDNSSLCIYDYDGVSWKEFGEPLTILSTDGISALEVSQNGKTFALLSSEVFADSYIFRWNGDEWVSTKASGPQDPRLGLQHGTLSADGGTMVLASTATVGYNTALIYEQRDNEWVVIETLGRLLPGKLLGMAVDARGDRLVVATQQTLQVYERVCINAPAPTPTPTTLSNESSGMPNCVDTFEPVFLHNLAQDLFPLGDDGNVTLFPLPDNKNETLDGISLDDSLPENTPDADDIFHDIVSIGKVVSSDGSILVVTNREGGSGQYFIDTYDLTNSSAAPERALFPDYVDYMAISAEGERLVFGVSSVPPSFVGILPFQPGGSFFIYRREGLQWEFEIEVPIGGGSSGGVVSAAISEDGNSMAFAAKGANKTGFVSAYTIQTGGFFRLLGNTLTDDWLDSETTVGLVDNRLFVSSSDGFVRTYNLVDNVWEQVGQSVSHFDAPVFIATGNNAIFATVSEYSDVIAHEAQGPYWLPVDVSSINDYLSSEALVSFAISRDGREMMVTELEVESSPNYIAKLYGQVDNSYQLLQEIELNLEGIIELTQLTNSGDFVVVTDTQVVAYQRSVSC